MFTLARHSLPNIPVVVRRSITNSPSLVKFTNRSHFCDICLITHRIHRRLTHQFLKPQYLQPVSDYKDVQEITFQTIDKPSCLAVPRTMHTFQWQAQVSTPPLTASTCNGLFFNQLHSPRIRQLVIQSIANTSSVSSGEHCFRYRCYKLHT